MTTSTRTKLIVKRTYSDLLEMRASLTNSVLQQQTDDEVKSNSTSSDIDESEDMQLLGDVFDTINTALQMLRTTINSEDRTALAKLFNEE